MRTEPARGVASTIGRLRSDHPLSRLAGRLANERFGLDARRLVPRIVAALPADVLAEDGRHVQSIDRTGTRIAVARVGPRGGPAVVIVLVPQTAGGEEALRRRAAAQDRLRADERLRAWSSRVPPVVQLGRLDGRAYLVEGALSGQPALRRAEDLQPGDPILERAADVAAELHGRTGHQIRADDRFDAWVRRPTDAILDALQAVGEAAELAPALRSLERRVERDLAGRSMTVGWAHGDYWPGNLLVDGRRDITGIVDWERADDDELPVLDLLHLVVYTAALVRRVEPGRIVREALAADSWRVADRDLLDRAAGWSNLPVGDRRTLLLLYWLRFVAATVEQSEYFVRHPRWRRENIERVLAEAVAGPGSG